MSNCIWECPACGQGIDSAITWARMLTNEPEPLAYPGPWGVPAYWPGNGTDLLAITCGRCGTTSIVPRECPLAAA
jgi:hypothetical protein